MINVLTPRRKGSSGDRSKSRATEPSQGTASAGGSKNSSSSWSCISSRNFINGSNTEATKESSSTWESSEVAEVAPAMTSTAPHTSILASQNAVSDDTKEVSTDATNSSNSEISNDEQNDGRNRGSNFGRRSSKNETFAALNGLPNESDGEDGRNESTNNTGSASEGDSDSSSSSSDDEGYEDNDDSDEGRQASNQSRSNNFHAKLDRTLLERDILQSLGSHDDLIDTKGLSDYELLRLRNIQRNERRMKELGLMTSVQNSLSGGIRNGSNGNRKEKIKERPKGIGTNGHVQQSPRTRTGNGNGSGNNLAGNSGKNNRRNSAIHETSQLALYYKTEQASSHAPKTSIHKRWMERYDELKVFYDTYGHIHVPSAKDCVASYTATGREPGGKSRNEEESNDVNNNSNSKPNTNCNSYQYKALRTWLTKQKRQYLLYTQGEKSSMDEDKMKLMQQLGGKEWWKQIENGGGYVWVVGVGWKRSGDRRNSVASDSGRLRKYSNTRRSWSDEDNEEDKEMRKRMMQEEGDYDNNGNEDGECSEYYEKESTMDETDSISDWSSSSDINVGEEEEEIGSVDSLDQEIVEDSIRHRTSLRRRSRRLRSGSRHMLHPFNDDNDGIHSTEDRLSSRSGSVQGDRYSSVERSRMDDNSHASRVSYNSSSEDDESYFRRRNSRNKRKLPRRRESHNSFKKINEFPREDKYERKATRARSKQRRITGDARENRSSESRSRSFSPSPVIRSRNNNSREPTRIRCRSPSPLSIRRVHSSIGNSFSPTRSNRKRSSLEQIQESDIEENNHGGDNVSTFDGLRHERSSKKRQRENSTRQARCEEVYYSEDDSSTAAYRRNRQIFLEREHSIRYLDRKDKDHVEIRALKRLRRHGNRYASNSPNRCSDSSTASVSRDEIRIKPTGGKYGHQLNPLNHSHKPMNEITIAPEGQIHHSIPSIDNVETTKNLLMAEYGRLYGKWSFILAKKNALRHEMSMLQSKIVIESQVLCGSSTNEFASLGLPCQVNPLPGPQSGAIVDGDAMTKSKQF